MRSFFREVGDRGRSLWLGWLATGAHTGAGAAALTASDSVRRHLPDGRSAAALAFCGVVALYGGRYLYQATGGVAGDRERWLRRHLVAAYFAVVLAMSGSLLFITHCETWRLVNLAVAGGVGLAYCFPVVGRPWREYGAIKPFLLALAWALVTSPWAGAEVVPFTVRFCALAGLCLLFDLKDVERDRVAGIETPARVCGPVVTRVLAAMFFLGAAGYAGADGRPDLAAESLVLMAGGYAGTRRDAVFRTIAIGDGAMFLAGLGGLALNLYFPQ